MVVAQALLVVGRGDDDFGRAQPAMPRAQIAGAHARDFERDRLVQEQGDDPADRRMNRGPLLPAQYIVFGK